MDNYKSFYQVSVLAAAIAIVSGERAIAENDRDMILEETVVTGSRLVRPGSVAPIPVTSIGADEIELSGATIIGDYIGDLPVFGLNSNRTNNVGGTPPDGIGANIMNLRNLGGNRTLVVVDGRRHVGSLAGSTAVDVGSIPTALIERVEISTGGASVAYGADAIAGVVNFITKKDFEGVQVNAQYGDSEHGGGESEYFTFTAGGNFGSGRGNAVFNITYNTEGGIRGDQRDWLVRQTAFVPNPLDTGPNDGIPAQILADGVRLSVFSETGNLIGAVNGQTMLLSDDGQSVRPFNPGTNLGGVFQVGGDGANTLDLQQVANPVERFSFQSNINYQINDNINFFAEGKFYSVEASNRSQPQFDAFTYFESGELFWVQPDNPFLPVNDPVFNEFFASNFGLILLSRTHTDLGFRTGVVDRETARFLAGIEGKFGGKDWNYELFVQYGDTSERRVQYNDRNPRRWRLSTDAVTDVLGVTGVAPGTPACRSTVEAALSGGTTDPDILDCKPVNIFGTGVASQEAIDYFSIDLLTNRNLQQFVTGGVVDGSLFELPAGPVTFATGFEYRKEQSNSQPDDALVSGQNFLGEILPVSGEYEVFETFLEARVPILADKKFANILAVEAGFRASEYDTVGSTTSWRIGGEWAPIEEIRFRAMQSEAVRAPNISELFQPIQQGFVSVQDPCDKDRIGLGPNPERRLANCMADMQRLGIDPTTFDDPFEGFGHDGIVGGNPNLEEEAATSTTFGLVYVPSMFEGRMVISIDYYDIEIENAISTPNSIDLINDCYDRFDSIDNKFCSLFSRNSSSGALRGSIENVVSTLLNIDTLKTDGYDIELDYSFDVNKLPGMFNVRLLGSHISSYEILPAADALRASEAAGTQNFPEWRANASLTYSTERFTASYNLRWVDSVVYSQFVSVDDDNPGESVQPWKTDPEMISDVRLGYRFNFDGFNLAGGESDDYEMYLGINNVFDLDPPPGIRQGGSATSTQYYDPIGRFIYAGITAKF